MSADQVNEKVDPSDSSVMAWISERSTTLLGIILFCWIIKKLLFATQHIWFPYVMYLCTKDEFPQIEEVKKDLFASLSTIVSCDPELRKQKAIRILEIGVGTGVNFAHYPEGSRLVVVDPNPNFKAYYNDNRKNFPNIQAEEFYVTTGDNMGEVGDNSIDVVVITLVLCSVPNVPSILREIRRVLVPGGKFYFLEHIAEFDLKKHWVRRHLQDVLTHLIPVWPVVFDGCCLNRETLPDIEKAGFADVDAQKFYAPVPNFLFWPEIPNVKGICTK